MLYPKCKVYSDGSHYIAIPHTERTYRPRRKPHEEVITVTDEISDGKKRETESAPSTEDAPLPLAEEVGEGDPKISVTPSEKSVIERQMTKKELFEELYEKYQSLPRYKRKAAILKGMRPYFQDAEAAKIYVEVNLRRKVRNLISRRTRMVRKINLQEFGFFVTVTYFYGQLGFVAKSNEKKYEPCLLHQGSYHLAYGIVHKSALLHSYIVRLFITHEILIIHDYLILIISRYFHNSLANTIKKLFLQHK